MRVLRSCCAAFRFLTVFPFPGKYGADLEDLRGSLVFFPLVGLVLGGVALAAAWLLQQVLPPLVTAVGLTFLLLFFSGGLHLDGLADCADGFFSVRDRERMLAIMRDSRIGVMGVIGLVMILLAKVTLLASLPAGTVPRAILLMPVAGRCSLVLMVVLLPYARKEGLGLPFYTSRSWWMGVAAVGVLSACGAAALGGRGMAAAVAVTAVVFLFSRLCHRRIGGATGDTLGAACELAETVVPFILLF